METKEQAAKAYQEAMRKIDNNSTYDSIDVDVIRYVAFKAGALQADTHPKSPWISVEDRLPKPEQEVLLYNSNSIQHYVVGWLRENKGYNKSIWSLNNGYVEDEDITHWMPIVEIVESK